MSTIINFLIGAVIYAVILAILPWVKHKGFGACLIVAIIMSILSRVVSVLLMPLVLGLAIWSVIPILGWLTGPPLLFLLVWFVNTLSLWLADQAIEDFEIKTFGQTALTALISGILYAAITSIF
mgnify:CR=1 FL=1